VTARTRQLAASAVAGVVGAVVTGAVAGVRYGVLAGWMVFAIAFLGITWVTIGPMTAEQTAAHASSEDPRPVAADVLVVAAALISLVAVGSLLLQGSSTNKDVSATASVVAVALAWASVHTVFTTRYARLYFTGTPGGVDWGGDEPPVYRDFAYLAFTVGMTFQVSDTAVTDRRVRAAVLRHALLSYLFGTVFIATMINLVAGLGR
jgi:uncharacterized membrane protein